MSDQNLGKTVSLPAAADYSSAGKYCYVKVNASRKFEVCSSTIDIIAGVLQNSPVTDKPASVAPLGSGGISKIYLSGTLAAGILVTTDASGHASADATGNYNGGILFQGGDVDELGSVILINQTVKA